MPQIITYQEKSGNYNTELIIDEAADIITYQEKSGNYNTIAQYCVIV